MKTVLKKIPRNTMDIVLYLEKQKQVYINKLKFEKDPSEIERLNFMLYEIDKSKDFFIEGVS